MKDKDKKMNYRELLAQADALRAQAEELRKQDAAAALDQIRELVNEYEISADELGHALGFKVAPAAGKHAADAAPAGRRRRKPEFRSKAAPRYRGPAGELWSGGAGRKPLWVVAALERGENMDQYLIDPSGAGAAGGGVDTTQQLDLGGAH